MKFKKIFFITVLLLTIFLISAVSASQNTTIDDESLIQEETIKTSPDILKDSSWDADIDSKTNSTDKKHVDFYISVSDDYNTSSIGNKSNFTVFLDNVSYDEVLTVEDNLIIITGPQNLSVGNYTYTVNCLDDGSFKTKAFTVTAPMSAQFDENYVYEYEDTNYKYEISIDLNNDIEGVVAVFIDNKQYVRYSLTYSNSFQINLVDVGCGIHDLEIIYEGTDDYPTYTIASKLNVTYDIDLSELDYEYYTSGDVLLNVSIPSLFMDNDFITTINGKTYSHYFNGYHILINASDLLAGEYTLVVKYLGDDKFYSDSFTNNFTVYDPSININFDVYDVQSIPYGSSDYYFYLNLPITNAKGNLVVEIWDDIDSHLLRNISSKLVNGKARVYIPSLPSGEYWYNSYYSGSDIDINEFSGVLSFAYVVTGPTNNSDIYECSVGDEQYVYLKVPGSVSGNLTVYLYNAVYEWECEKKDLINQTSAKIANGEAKIKLPLNKLGIYYIEANYSGDAEVENYACGFKVMPINLILPQEVSIARQNNFTIVLPSDAYGNVTLHFKEYEGQSDVLNVTFEVKNGFATYDLLNCDLLYDYYIYVEYNGNYGNVEIPIEDNSIRFSDETALIVEDNGIYELIFIIPDTEGNITVYLNNNPIKRGELVNGYLNFTLENLPYGKNCLSAYLDDDIYHTNLFGNDIYDNDNIFVKKSTNITATGNGADSNSNLVVKITLDKYTTGNIGLEINGKTFNTTLQSGITSINCGKLAAGTYNVQIKYLGDDNYLQTSYSTKLTITKATVSPKIVASNLNMYYASGAKYTIKVYDKYSNLANNVLVTIKIGKKVFKLKTKNGVVTLKIPNTITPKKYKIVISSLGVKTTKKLNVKQILKLKKVNVKKSAKKLILKATLKKGKTPLKSKTIKFVFNNKVYKTKTNKKGVAKVVIKQSVLKKLRVGKKLTYKAIYIKNTVKKTVKIKK